MTHLSIDSHSVNSPHFLKQLELTEAMIGLTHFRLDMDMPKRLSLQVSFNNTEFKIKCLEYLDHALAPVTRLFSLQKLYLPELIYDARGFMSETSRSGRLASMFPAFSHLRK